jgi:hypothetical protein
MSTNAPRNSHMQLPFPSESRQQDGGTSGRETLPSPSTPPPSHGENRQQYTLKIFLTLLVSICLYALGSFSLAPHLLPAAFFQSPQTAQTKLAQANSTQQAKPVGGGACHARPGDMHYLPAGKGGSAKASQSSQLPQAWRKAGLNEEDFAYAQACAASFLIAYQSFDSNKPPTFESTASLLSIGGQQRFYGRGTSKTSDVRMNPYWRASMQKQQLRQSARVNAPALLQAQSLNGRVLVWMSLHYQLTISRGNQTLTSSSDMAVLLASVPQEKGRTAWQVSYWQDGNALFPVPKPL